MIATDKYGEGSPSKLNRDATVGYYTNKIASRKAMQKAPPVDEFGALGELPPRKKDE